MRYACDYFLLKDLGLALAPQMCPDQSQAFKEVNNSQSGVYRFQVLQGMFAQNLAQIFGELTA